MGRVAKVRRGVATSMLNRRTGFQPVSIFRMKSEAPICVILEQCLREVRSWGNLLRMSVYSILLPLSCWNLRVKNGRTTLPAVFQILLLPGFVFCGLTSVWLLSNSSDLVQALWYGSSSTLLFGVAGLMTYELMGRALFRPGGSSGMPPMAGAPCPVPIRPTPHLVRSAAEPLPSEKRKEARIYQAREETISVVNPSERNDS